MNDVPLEDMGPVDYLVVEWTGNLPQGEALPHLIDLVERGVIHLLDLAFMAKDEGGNVVELSIEDLGDEYAVFEGASSGLLGEDDVSEAAAALEPGTAAALLVYENTWAAPFAKALRKSGAQLVATGRIPIQQLVASFEAAEANA